MGEVLPYCCGRGLGREKTLDAIENFPGRASRMNDATEFAAIPHAVRKPASELLHFAYGVGQIRSANLAVVSGK
jgi:hypothetical protein